MQMRFSAIAEFIGAMTCNGFFRGHQLGRNPVGQPKDSNKIDLQDSWTKQTSNLEEADIAMCGTSASKARRQMAAAGSKGNLDAFGEAHSPQHPSISRCLSAMNRSGINQNQ